MLFGGSQQFRDRAATDLGFVAARQGAGIDRLRPATDATIIPETVTNAQGHDAVRQGRNCSRRWRDHADNLASRRKSWADDPAGTGRRRDVPKGITGLDAGELMAITEEDHPRPRGQGIEGIGQTFDVDHRHFIENQQVAGQGMVGIVADTGTIGAHAQMTMEGGGATSELGPDLGRQAGTGETFP